MKTIAITGLAALLVGASMEVGGTIRADGEAKTAPAEVESIRTGQAALSPDGRHVAYSVREGSTLSVIVAGIDAPHRPTVKVVVASDETSKAILSKPGDVDRAKIAWLGWVSPQRVAVATNGAELAVYFADVDPLLNSTDTSPAGRTQTRWSDARGFVFAFDVDGKNAKKLTSPRKAGGSVHVVGVDADASNSLVVISRGENLVLNTRTGKLRFADPQRAERARNAQAARDARWAALRASVMTEIQQAMPGKSLEVLDNDQAACHFLISSRDPADPAAFYVFDRAEQRLIAFARGDTPST